MRCSMRETMCNADSPVYFCCLDSVGGRAGSCLFTLMFSSGAISLRSHFALGCYAGFPNYLVNAVACPRPLSLLPVNIPFACLRF